jgi:hypothetical protein
MYHAPAPFSKAENGKGKMEKAYARHAEEGLDTEDII